MRGYDNAAAELDSICLGLRGCLIEVLGGKGPALALV